jgi:cystathionine beta-lyase family protein involved in aluminum resistance
MSIKKAMKIAVFAFSLFENLGFKVFLKLNLMDSDIVQEIKLKNEENLIISIKKPV